jgi:hypothetical protein
MSSAPAPAAQPTAWQKFLAQLQASTSSRYTQANAVYLLYTSLIMFINLSLSKRANDAYTDDVCACPPSLLPPPPWGSCTPLSHAPPPPRPLYCRRRPDPRARPSLTRLYPPRRLLLQPHYIRV